MRDTDSAMPPKPRAPRADGDITRNRLLEAAGELIGAQGFAETTSKAIAARAEADLASINYHFGSRAGLYAALLAEAHRRLIDIEDLRRIAALRRPAATKLRRLMDGLIRAASGPQGWPAQVLGRELLSPSSHLAVLEETEIRPKLRILLGILAEISGIPPEHPAAARCLISVMAPCAVLLAAGGKLPFLAREVLATRRTELVDHFLAFAIAGLKATGRELPPPH